ncbi:arginyltransferase [Halopseudomonas salegens]|uniref:Aspartate/glutamate leucyltransferase n=1 Tax=Halopseudomonas salegens TaxID=1434072 RepID=A0A1H2FJ68_9GAMM|nr:arginyltransferase [Halopseudomonas salegens]SDU07381.1 arginine-tRNA-protein transferase [Halopseudomonas salegens]
MTNLAQLKFFATQPHTCSYLPEERATTLFLDPQQSIDLTTYSRLSDLGFRRSGDHLYRPHCERCSACIAARIPVDRFTPNKQQKRILRRNQDIRISEHHAVFNEEHYALFARYIEQRHADGDMYPPSREQFESFLVRDHSFTRFFEFRLEEQLIAVAVTDIMENGLSAVYTYFAPEHERRSLGRFAILWQVEEARRRQLPALYLGYWIKQCRKMNYKTEYRPLEMLVNQRWVAIS